MVAGPEHSVYEALVRVRIGLGFVGASLLSLARVKRVGKSDEKTRAGVQLVLAAALRPSHRCAEPCGLLRAANSSHG